jgi:type IV pilus assembly protein PilP
VEKNRRAVAKSLSKRNSVMVRHYRHWLNSTRSRLIMPGFILLGLLGCSSGDMTDLKGYVAEVKGRPKSAIDPLPEVKAVEPFVFNAEDLRDPFIPDEKSQEPEEEKVESGIRPDPTRSKEELESYELDNLRMVGTVNRQGVLWGLVKGGDGTIHRIRTGNYIGKNYGKIVNIKENSVELVEIVSDGSGVWHERKAGLELAEVSGGNK